MKIRKEVKMGIFAIAMLAIAYWGINFLKGIDILSSNNEYYAYYEKSENIEISSPILIRGIKVGSVTNVEISTIQSKVKMTLAIKKKYKLPIDSEAEITNKSMLGGKAIVIKVGGSSEVLKKQSEIKGVIDNNMSEQIDEVKTKLYEVVSNLTKTLQDIDNLLSEENIKNLSATFNNINKTTEGLNKIVNSNKIPNIIANLESVTADFKNSTPSLKSTLHNIDSITSAIKNSDVESLLTSINTTVTDLNKTVVAINNGQGSVGKLIYDPSLYNNLDKATVDLSALLSDLKSNPKRYVHFSL
ncbi:MAG: MlaD family protein, partial [Rikenellaceae bacterium]